MGPFVLLLLLVISVHTLSFAKYNWDRGNKRAAVGAALMALISIALPAIVMFTRP